MIAKILPHRHRRRPRRLLLTASLVTLVCSGPCPSGAYQSTAANPRTPEQTVRDFYELLAEGRCQEAIALRPEYKLDSCQAFEMIALNEVKKRLEAGDNALVSIDLEYRSRGAKKHAEGCAALRRMNGVWIYDKYDRKDCEELAGTVRGAAAREHEPLPRATSGRKPPASGITKPVADARGAPTDATRDPAEGATVLARPIPKLEASGSAPIKGAAEPVDTLRQYYEAMDSGDCETVVRIRPGYTKCAVTKSASVSDVEEVLYSDEIGVAVIGFRADITRREDGETRPGSVDGYAWMERRGGEWKLINVYGESRGQEVTERFAQAQANDPTFAPPSPADATLSSEQIRQEPIVPAPQYTPMPAELDRAVSDSLALLERCWTREALIGSSAEKRIVEGLLPNSTPPPRYLIDLVERTTRRSLPGGTRGSIRWVDLYDPNDKVIALTFDLCEQADEITGYAPDIVNYLRDNNVPATFFAGGKWMRSHPERTKQLMLDPLFEVGNHAWTHGNMRVLAGQEMRDQIVWTQAQYMQLHDELYRDHAGAVEEGAIQQIPMMPSTFRFPYGTCSNESLDALADSGLAAIQWNIVTGDPSSKQTAEGIADQLLKGVKPGRGSIAIMHANGRGWNTAEALRKVIPKLRSRGYRFVTVNELLRLGTPHSVPECYEVKPGDNAHYDKIFGRGTGD